MTFAAAHAEIVAKVVALAPTKAGLSLGGAFHHDPKGNELRPGGPARRFWLVVDSGGGVTPSASFSKRHRVQMAITVEYPAIASQYDEATIAIVEDANLIGKDLTNGRWNRPASSIIAISADGQTLTTPWTIERGPNGWRLRMTFSLEYES